MAKMYDITCTKIYNGNLRVQANSEKEALAIAEERMDKIDWIFGEATIDYAEEVK